MRGYLSLHLLSASLDVEALLKKLADYFEAEDRDIGRLKRVALERVSHHPGAEDLLAMLRQAAGEEDSRCIVVSDALVQPTEGRLVASQLTQDIRTLFGTRGPLCGLVALSPGAATRTRDVDRTLSAVDATPERVAAAVDAVADGLAMRAPPTREDRERPRRPVRIHLVTSRKELERCLLLRFQVYTVMGYLDDNVLESSLGIEVDAHDRNSLHLAALDHESGDVVGTVRMIAPGPGWDHPEGTLDPFRQALIESRTRVPYWLKKCADRDGARILARRLTHPPLQSLPIFETYGFKPEWRGVLKARHHAELSRLVVHPDYRGHGVSTLLIRATVASALALGRKRLVLECLPRHESLYRKSGFRSLDWQLQRVRHLDQEAIAMLLDLHQPLTQRAMGLARHDLEMIRRPGGVQRHDLRPHLLCACANGRCWRNGSYDSCGRPGCPLGSSSYLTADVPPPPGG